LKRVPKFQAKNREKIEKRKKKKKRDEVKMLL
jgi:hypothetical protein